MGPSIDPRFTSDNQKYEDLLLKYVRLKELESNYFSVLKLTPFAHRENFLQQFHITSWSNEQIERELLKLEEKVLPRHLAAQKAAEAEKQAEQKAAAERDKGSDFEMDFD